MNTVPAQYRSVSVATVDVPFTVDALTAHFLGREVYRHTHYVVVHSASGPEATALVEVAAAGGGAGGPLFSPVTDVRVRALPDECVAVHDPEVDTCVPSALAEVARRAEVEAARARCVVVHGRYDHVSFILDPSPVRLRVADLVPPEPAKLVDQARRVLAVAEDLPPVELVPEVVDLTDLARTHPYPRYLLPCRASGFHLEGAEVSFLDERPPRRDWTLVGCARSRAIHQWFYGDLPAFVDTCPLNLFPAGGDRAGPLLTKCCLLENDNRTDGARVAVPWGASLALVKEAVAQLAAAADPAWAPA
jgi:hypothetical protein